MSVAAEPRLCLPPVPLSRSPRARLPDGTIDSHFHVFRTGAPLALPRSYTPHTLTLDDWREYANEVGIARGVLVQPSVYGFDNSVMLDALATAPDRLRGIAVVEPTISDAELQRLHQAGIRGVRCNTRNLGGLGFDLAVVLAQRIAPLGWTLQFQVRPEQFAALSELAPSLGLPVVLDHFGFIATIETSDPLPRLRQILDAGNCYLKLSAPYRLDQVYSSPPMGALVRGLVDSHPERLLWGSDWPHTELFSSVPDDADLIDELMAHLSGEALRRTILIDNATSLFFSN